MKPELEPGSPLDPESDRLISGYLDASLFPEEHAALAVWLKQSPDNIHRFARAVLLDDRLRGELLSQAAVLPQPSPAGPAAVPARRRFRQVAAIVSAAAAAAVLAAVLWRGLGETPVSAAAVELNRLIAANSDPVDRTYQIVVDDASATSAAPRPDQAEHGRPPKPPLDGAILYVRRGDQFVLIRKTRDGLPFVTGSNGKTSWAVSPDGPVRVSSDLTRFNRDVPGHEHAMSLIHIDELLERLRTAYDVQLAPVERSASNPAPGQAQTRLLIAVKKRGYRGPRRVEITYATPSGRIRRLRFIDMPYGPDRLNLSLTLLDERARDAMFFDHESHHAPGREVAFE